MGKFSRRVRCPKCGSLCVIKWGVRNNHQRYKCSECGALFTPRRKDVGASNRFVWFRKWVLGKQTIKDIAANSGYSERQLRRWFEEYLDGSPEWRIQRRKGIHMLIDGTWLAPNRCLVVYRDFDTKSTLYYRFSTGEIENEIIRDLQVFKAMRLRISSFTTDGGNDIIRALKYSYPHVARQRCVVHIERECLTWLTQHPRTSAGILLRRLVCQISDIRTSNDKCFWIRELNKWHEDYEEFIAQRTVNKDTGETTYTHDSVRKAYIHLRRAMPNMFKCIDDPDIPTNTNSLESFFGHLKDNLRIHRGMSSEHRDNFVKWYLFFANEKKKKEG